MFFCIENISQTHNNKFITLPVIKLSGLLCNCFSVADDDQVPIDGADGAEKDL